MTNRDDNLTEYLNFIAKYPDLYQNPEGGVEVLLNAEEILATERKQAERLRAEGLPQVWARLGIQFEDQYSVLVRDAVRFPDGSSGTYFRILPKPLERYGAVMLPLWQGRIVLLRHFRHATRTWHLEAPRGSAEAEETTEMDVRRELAEEMGGIVERLHSLGTMHVSTSHFPVRMSLFLAELSAMGEPALGEGITGLVLATPEEFIAMIDRDEITDSHTLAAFTKARIRGLL
ncbi:MAG: NUDIX hydrolase [Alphaproteobacteria bacterium]